MYKPHSSPTYYCNSCEQRGYVTENVKYEYITVAVASINIYLYIQYIYISVSVTVKHNITNGLSSMLRVF